MSHAVAVFHGPFGRATLYELDRGYTPHAHREAHLLFSLGGHASVTVSGRQATTSMSTAVAINPWEIHSFHPVGKCGHFLIFYISPSWFRSIANSDAGLRFATPELQLTDDIRTGADIVAAKLVTGELFAGLDRLIYDLTEMCRAQSMRQAAELHQPAADVKMIDFRVRKSMRILGQRLAEDPDLDLVARESGLSRPHFYKLFRQETGVTPLVFLNTLRMERAVTMVATTDTSITAISDLLGFSCQSVFTRFFASHVGMAPSDYRRAARVLHA